MSALPCCFSAAGKRCKSVTVALGALQRDFGFLLLFFFSLGSESTCGDRYGGAHVGMAAVRPCCSPRWCPLWNVSPQLICFISTLTAQFSKATICNHCFFPHMILAFTFGHVKNKSCATLAEEVFVELLSRGSTMNFLNSNGPKIVASDQ